LQPRFFFLLAQGFAMLSLSAPMRSQRSTLSTSMLQRLRQARAERELQTPAAPIRQAPLTSATSAPVVVAQTNPPSAGITRPTLRRGSRSSDVALAQRLVGEAGFSAGLRPPRDCPPPVSSMPQRGMPLKARP